MREHETFWTLFYYQITIATRSKLATKYSKPILRTKHTLVIPQWLANSI